MTKNDTKKVGTKKNQNEESSEMRLHKKDEAIMRDLCEVFDGEVGKSIPPNWNEMKTALAEAIVRHVDEMPLGEKNQRLAHMIWDRFCGFLGEVDPTAKSHLRGETVNENWKAPKKKIAKVIN